MTIGCFNKSSRLFVYVASFVVHINCQICLSDTICLHFDDNSSFCNCFCGWLIQCFFLDWRYKRRHLRNKDKVYFEQKFAILLKQKFKGCKIFNNTLLYNFIYSILYCKFLSKCIAIHAWASQHLYMTTFTTL